MKRKVLMPEELPGFAESIANMPDASRIYVDKSLAIVLRVYEVMERKGLLQKDLADKMGKTEPEISRMLSGMHNITLRMIAKLEAALGEDILRVPTEYTQSNPEADNQQNENV